MVDDHRRREALPDVESAVVSGGSGNECPRSGAVLRSRRYVATDAREPAFPMKFWMTRAGAWASRRNVRKPLTV